MLNPQMNGRGAVKHRPRPASVAEPTISPDSLLEGDGFEPSVPHKKQPFLAAPVRSPQFAFRNKKRLFRARDRWFESISLQRGVRCELDITEPARPKGRLGQEPRLVQRSS